MRYHAFKISISKGFRKCAFSFIERVGISGGSFLKKMNVNCLIFYQVTETGSFIVIGLLKLKCALNFDAQFRA